MQKILFFLLLTLSLLGCNAGKPDVEEVIRTKYESESDSLQFQSYKIDKEIKAKGRYVVYYTASFTSRSGKKVTKTGSLFFYKTGDDIWSITL